MVSVTHTELHTSQKLDEILAFTGEKFIPSSFFTSNEWMACWLNSIKEGQVNCLTFMQCEEIVGVAFLGIASHRHLIPGYKQALLNQTNSVVENQHWIEFNEIITSDKYREACIEALLDFSLNQLKADELHVSMSMEFARYSELFNKYSLTYESQEIPSYKADITTPLTAESLIQRLSKSSRSQLKRSKNKLEQDYGSLKVCSAEPEEKTDYFNALGNLHIAQWQHTVEGSGFSNPVFLKHHLAYITNSNVHLLKISAGDFILGYGYFIVWGDTVYFYCSGLTQATMHKHIKPGYLFHLAAMSYFSEKSSDSGLIWYDFLGGESQYKNTLSTEKYYFNTFSVYRNSVRAKLYKRLKNLKLKLTPPSD